MTNAHRVMHNDHLFFVLTSKREEFYWGKKKNKNQRVKEINNTY